MTHFPSQDKGSYVQVYDFDILFGAFILFYVVIKVMKYAIFNKF